MKLEQSERLFVETLFNHSISRNKIENCDVHDVEKLTGDASTRRYYRVFTDKTHYVVCLDDPQPNMEKSSFMAVHTVFSKNNVRVPRLYDYDLKKGYYLEEDLGDETLLTHLSDVKNNDEEYEVYKKCVDHIIKIHSIDPTKYKNEIYTTLSFDQNKLMEEIKFTFKYFLNYYLEADLDFTQEKELEKEFSKICKIISSEKMVITHRDYHSRNIMYAGGEKAIIDFQDARLGIPQYDLVSLLEDCYYNLKRKNIYELKQYYWESFLEKTGFQKNYEKFLYLYDLTLIQRVFKAIGSFSYIYHIRQDKRYVKYIGYGFEKVRKTMMRYPELDVLRKSLSRIYYEN